MDVKEENKITAKKVIKYLFERIKKAISKKNDSFTIFRTEYDSLSAAIQVLDKYNNQKLATELREFIKPLKVVNDRRLNNPTINLQRMTVLHDINSKLKAHFEKGAWGDNFATSHHEFKVLERTEHPGFRIIFDTNGVRLNMKEYQAWIDLGDDGKILSTGYAETIEGYYHKEYEASIDDVIHALMNWR